MVSCKYLQVDVNKDVMVANCGNGVIGKTATLHFVK